MKLAIVAFCLVVIAFKAWPQGFSGGCGVAPIPPTGFVFICVCDNMGNNCRNVLVKV